MSNNIENRFKTFIRENKLIEKGDGIVVGLSGGPDSVCLLNMLCSIREEFNLRLSAVHINHMLRGAEADGDEEYSKKLCSKLNVEFFSRKIDINKYATEKGLSSEEAGREVRYECFEEVMKKLNYNKIATAHNANDQAETILMRIMRGTGLEGLGGIPVKRDEVYIRPILFMLREEIENYCKVNNLETRIDSTNLQRIYSRNKIRLDILPYMKENFNSDVVQAINRMALLLQDDNDFIEKEVDKIYNSFCTYKDNTVTLNKEIFNEERAILNRAIRRAILQVSGSIYNVQLKNIEDIYTLGSLGTNKKIDLPNGVIAENIYGNVVLKKRDNVKNKVEQDDINIHKEDIIDKKVLFGNYEITFEKIENKQNIKFNKSNLIKYFDFNKINGNIIIRSRKNGDKIIPLGMNGSKKIKDLFIDMKIPKELRDEIPIVQFDEEIAWVVGLKVSNNYKITDQTTAILKIVCKERA